MYPLNLYIHIPFCASKCHYCHFFSLTNKQKFITEYFNSLEKEVDFWKPKLINYQIQTIYFGGGTPSLVDPILISNLLTKIKQTFNVPSGDLFVSTTNGQAPKASRGVLSSRDLPASKAGGQIEQQRKSGCVIPEITLEANPETITQEKLEIYNKSNINRLSFGLQSCNNQILKYLGRNSKFEDFTKAYKLARKIGFKNINIDLIFGIPNQTLADWQQTLQEVSKFNPEHISCYSLELDNNSYFGKQILSHKLKPLGETLDRAMYHFAVEFLKSKNYNHYEISNFAKPNFECLHNLNFWNGGEYLGIGAGAHSFLQNKSFNHEESLEQYILSPTNISNLQKYTKKDLNTKNLILNLRLIDGVDIAEYNQKNKTDLLEIFNSQFSNLQYQKLIKITKTTIKLTQKGLDFQNQISKTII